MNNKRKSPAIGIICCLMAIVVVGVLAYAFLRESPSGEVPAETERSTETIVVTDPAIDETSEDESHGEVEIPDIQDVVIETKKDPSLNMDVTEVTLNPNPELIDSSIEYTTKEVPTDAE